MADLMQLRLAAREIFGEALRAVDPATAIGDKMRIEDSRLVICDTEFELPPKSNVFGIAIGKASERMAYAVEKILGDRFVDCVIAGPRRAGRQWKYFEGGHPLPNQQSLEAAKAAIKLLNVADHERSAIFFLISGGGSAMFELPISDDITLEDLRSANEILVGCGASISEVNAVRRAFSAVKGGRLAGYAPKSQLITLIVSDVPKGEEHNVASGPTWAPPADAPFAAEVVARYELADRLPRSIMSAIEQSANAEPGRDNHAHFVLLDNNKALEAAASAARARGFATEIAHDITDEPIEIGCEKLLTRLNELQNRHPDANVCLISGGEFACPVRGEGMGGRNSETALRLALAVNKDRERYKEFVALCAGTDGIDGNSLAAGALADSTTIERARDMNLDVSDFLDNSASAALFEVLEDAIETGLTGTNVRDVRILLSAPHKVK
jgi:hydroxypyruvate reductase